jgi:hypothetical protein
MRWARIADLVVLAQQDPNGPAESIPRADIILGCGRPVIFVPYRGRFDHLGQTTLVGWNGSREAARAVPDAIPLMLQKALKRSYPSIPKHPWYRLRQSPRTVGLRRRRGAGQHRGLQRRSTADFTRYRDEGRCHCHGRLLSFMVHRSRFGRSDT